jgi:hypothetical protein
MRIANENEAMPNFEIETECKGCKRPNLILSDSSLCTLCEDILDKGNNCIKLFVSIVKALDEEQTRFIGLFKHSQKKEFNILTSAVTEFNIRNSHHRANVECEELQEYLHELISDWISEGKKDIVIFAALCRTLKVIYMEYFYKQFKQKDRSDFMSMLLIADGFSKSIENDKEVNEQFQTFCTTLIEGNEYKRMING